MSEQKIKAKRVLFFDSGVGGLSILSASLKLNPNIEAYYLFDNECFPYGTKSEDFLIHRVVDLVDRAVKRFEVCAVVIACNTASTITLPALRARLEIPVVGVVPAIKPAAKLSKNKVIGLLATPGTASRAYTRDLISTFARDCRIISVGDGTLAVTAERRMSGENIDVDRPGIREILRPLWDTPDGIIPDTVVLGCTHYPFLSDIFSEILPDATIIDSGEAVGRRIRTVIKNLPEREVENISHQAFYTGILHNPDTRKKMFSRFGFEDLCSFTFSE